MTCESLDAINPEEAKKPALNGPIEEQHSGKPAQADQVAANAIPVDTGELQQPPSSAEPRDSSSVPDRSPSKRWGILVKQEIEAQKLIRVPDLKYEEKNCFKHASYDLRLGAEYVMIDAGDQGHQLQIGNCEVNGMITIQPYASAIVSAYELVALPDNVAGRFDLRIQHALEGLIVQRGTQIEPGYDGPLFALIHNISNQRKTLKFRDYTTRPFTIEFTYTSQRTIPPPNTKSTIRDFIPPNFARGGIDQALSKIESVQQKVNEVSKDLSLKKLGFFTGVVILFVITSISVVVPWALSKFTYDKDYFPIVNADAVAAMKYGPNRASDDAIVQRVLQELQAKDLTGGSIAQENVYVEQLRRLKAKRDSLLNDPSKAKELAEIQKQIDHVLELLRK